MSQTLEAFVFSGIALTGRIFIRGTAEDKKHLTEKPRRGQKFQYLCSPSVARVTSRMRWAENAECKIWLQRGRRGGFFLSGVRIGLIWLRIQTFQGSCDHGNEPWGFGKKASLAYCQVLKKPASPWNLTCGPLPFVVIFSNIMNSDFKKILRKLKPFCWEKMRERL